MRSSSARASVLRCSMGLERLRTSGATFGWIRARGVASVASRLEVPATQWFVVVHVGYLDTKFACDKYGNDCSTGTRTVAALPSTTDDRAGRFLRVWRELASKTRAKHTRGAAWHHRLGTDFNSCCRTEVLLTDSMGATTFTLVARRSELSRRYRTKSRTGLQETSPCGSPRRAAS